jgi:L-ornithine N5-oxygenase
VTVDVDVLGIGFGPGNIALAVALDESDSDLAVRYVERNPIPAWQSGMLLDGSDIQHNAARDLALPRNPRSRYTFYNYLFEHGRLFEYLNLGLPYPFRKDYARYVTWVAEQFAGQVDYGVEVTALRVADGDGVALLDARLSDGRSVRSHAAVVAPGRQPRIPQAFANIVDERVFHSSVYLHRREVCERIAEPVIVVIGASQSAVELVLDISRSLPRARVVNVLRDFGHRQKDLSPFTNEVYFPAFTDYYYDATEESKADLDRQLRHTNYSAADPDVLQALYVQMYEDRLDGVERVQLVRNTAVSRVRTAPDGVHLVLTERHRGGETRLRADAVVLATGYYDLTDESGPEFLPPVLAGIAGRVGRTPTGRALVGRDYRLQPPPGGTLPPIYLNGLCETTHGLGDAGSFSLLSLRSSTIATSLAKDLAVTLGWSGASEEGA